jgi:4-aminobutyrate aminotransferase-like enzyme
MSKRVRLREDAVAPAQDRSRRSDAELLALEDKYCSHGDTVHYTNPPKIFESCEGSFLYDADGRRFLDLQMWYSAVNFGYRNPRLDAAARRQLDRLPQVASQYLHREKIELAAIIAQDAERKFASKGRVHFNVGGSQAVEDSLKLVRNFKKGKSLMFAFEGGYHGRTLGASAITSSYRYRRRYGHFGDRAHFVPFPYHFRGPKGLSKEEYGHHCVRQFARLFESEASTTACGIRRRARPSMPPSTWSRSRARAAT